MSKLTALGLLLVALSLLLFSTPYMNVSHTIALGGGIIGAPACLIAGFLILFD